MSQPLATFLSTICLLAISIVDSAHAQVMVSTTSFQTNVSATTGPGSCTNFDGGTLVPDATASCVDQKGNSALASSQADATSTVDGGSVFAHAEATATATGIPPFEQPNGNASANGLASWTIGSDTLYSLALTIAGDASASLSTNESGPLPSSGVLTPDSYSLVANASAFAVARDVDGAAVVTATPGTAEGHLTLVPLGSPTLIMGTVLAEGVGRSGLLVEALDAGQLVVAQTTTGNDGSYLLDDLTGPVTIRASDPAGLFESQTSAATFPPATIDFDLDAIATVPLLSPGMLPWLVIVIGGLGYRRSTALPFALHRWFGAGRTPSPGQRIALGRAAIEPRHPHRDCVSGRSGRAVR